MPRIFSSIDKIRAELAWVNETPDPNKCGRRSLRCCKETEHKAGACTGAVQRSSGRFGWSTTVRPDVNADGGGGKPNGYMTAT